MYVPDQFKETDPDRISDLIETYPFATLVTSFEGEPFVSYLPMIFERGLGANGSLLGHMARANSQWRHLASGARVQAIFQGPHVEHHQALVYLKCSRSGGREGAVIPSSAQFLWGTNWGIDHF